MSNLQVKEGPYVSHACAHVRLDINAEKWAQAQDGHNAEYCYYIGSLILTVVPSPTLLSISIVP